MNPFESHPFFSHTFSMNTFRGVGKPVPPVPVPVSASAGGWGGGKGMMLEDLPPEIADVDSEKSTLATRKTSDKRGQSSTELRRTATRLRARIAELEAKLAETNNQAFAPLGLYLSAMEEIRRLKATIAGVEAQVEALKAEIALSYSRPDPEADFVYDYTPLENISLPSFDSIWERVTAGVHGIAETRKPPAPFPWTEVALATAGFVLAANAPDDWKAVRAVGYACASALAISAFGKLLKHLS